MTSCLKKYLPPQSLRNHLVKKLSILLMTLSVLIVFTSCSKIGFFGSPNSFFTPSSPLSETSPDIVITPSQGTAYGEFGLEKFYINNDGKIYILDKENSNVVQLANTLEYANAVWNCNIGVRENMLYSNVASYCIEEHENKIYRLKHFDNTLTLIGDNDYTWMSVSSDSIIMKGLNNQFFFANQDSSLPVNINTIFSFDPTYLDGNGTIVDNSIDNNQLNSVVLPIGKKFFIVRHNGSAPNKLLLLNANDNSVTELQNTQNIASINLTHIDNYGSGNYVFLTADDGNGAKTQFSFSFLTKILSSTSFPNFNSSFMPVEKRKKFTQETGADYKRYFLIDYNTGSISTIATIDSSLDPDFDFGIFLDS